MISSHDICPECSKPEGIPIIWGKPPAEAADQIARGEVICGGCDIWSSVCGTVMNRECQACGHRGTSKALTKGWRTASYAPT